MRVLVTGATGFVGRHTVHALETCASVFTTSRRSTGRPGHHPVDLHDPAAIHDLIRRVQPDVVVHLAAIAQPRGHSEEAVFALNVDASVHLAEALWRVCPEARLVAVSTGYVHGETAEPAGESAPLAPVGAYARSKAQMEASLERIGEGRDLCIVRPFNHTGPGQPDGYAVPAFFDKACAVNAGRAEHLDVGDLTAVRDLADVRDLAAGLALLTRLPRVPPVLQICSGQARTMHSVLDAVRQTVGGLALDAPVRAVGTSALRRNVGDPSLAHALGIRTRPLSVTLHDLWTTRLSRAGAEPSP